MSVVLSVPATSAVAPLVSPVLAEACGIVLPKHSYAVRDDVVITNGFGVPVKNTATLTQAFDPATGLIAHHQTLVELLDGSGIRLLFTTFERAKGRYRPVAEFVILGGGYSPAYDVYASDGAMAERCANHTHALSVGGIFMLDGVFAQKRLAHVLGEETANNVLRAMADVYAYHVALAKKFPHNPVR